MGLPVAKILWAPSNSAHYNHLHVEGDPRYAQHEMPTKGAWTPAIKTIFAALELRFGQGEHFQVPDWNGEFQWTHMGVYNPRYIAGTKIWSQHAGANAIDIGPYYGVEQQQKFYDFLTGKDEMFTAHEIEVLKDIVAALDEVGSNGSFAKYAVGHLRNHPSSGGGVSREEYDSHRHAEGKTGPPIQ